jgi:hypothetical protein
MKLRGISLYLSSLHDYFNATGVELVVKSELRFRSQQELTGSLSHAGFTVEYSMSMGTGGGERFQKPAR